MERRHFLSALGMTFTLPSFRGLGFRVHTRPVDAGLLHHLTDTDRVLVLIQLNGGNDGLNMVIPVDQYSAYHALRSNIAIPESQILPLASGSGLHPVMTGAKWLFDEGRLSVVQGVSYPNPNLSHFRATDIWMSGADSNQYLTSGWTGRFLEALYPGYPDGYPSASMPDPPGMQIGAVMSLALQGPESAMGIAIQDPWTFYQLVNGSPSGGTDTPPTTPAGKELTYIRQVQTESQQFATQIKNAADKAANLETYPTPNALADQLKIVARLIAGGLHTRIYLVSLGGFDTHSEQVDPSNTMTGDHANLLKFLSTALMAFEKDLIALGVDSRVATMTFSEFGRRVKSNSSLGTDHGTAAPMLIVGSNLVAPVHGSSPNLGALINDNLPMQFDFRGIYASTLRQWFGLNTEDTRRILGTDYPTLPIFSTQTTSTDYPANLEATSFVLHAPWPNPARDQVWLSLTLSVSEDLRYRIVDMSGRTYLDRDLGPLTPGEHSFALDLSPLPAGVYTLVADSHGRTQHARIVRR